jgi:predicted peptidase
MIHIIRGVFVVNQHNITPSNERGKVTLYACQYDQRFSYYTYIPKTYDQNQDTPSTLAVIVHGSERAAQSFEVSSLILQKKIIRLFWPHYFLQASLIQVMKITTSL